MFAGCVALKWGLNKAVDLTRLWSRAKDELLLKSWLTIQFLQMNI